MIPTANPIFTREYMCWTTTTSATSTDTRTHIHIYIPSKLYIHIYGTDRKRRKTRRIQRASHLLACCRCWAIYTHTHMNACFLFLQTYIVREYKKHSLHLFVCLICTYVQHVYMCVSGYNITYMWWNPGKKCAEKSTCASATNIKSWFLFSIFFLKVNLLSILARENQIKDVFVCVWNL